MKKWVTVFIVAWIMIVGVFLMIRQQRKSDYEVRSSSHTVIKQIRSLNRLETASFTIEKVIDAGTSGGSFQELLFGDRILLIAHGEVIAGFDLSQISENDLVVEGNTIRLSLPSPQILVARLDNDQTRVFDRKQGLLTKGDANLESEARKAAEGQIRTAACQGNILKTASDNGRKQLTALLSSLQFQTVIITIPVTVCQ